MALTEKKPLEFQAEMLTEERNRIVTVGSIIVAALSIIIPVSTSLMAQLFVQPQIVIAEIALSLSLPVRLSFLQIVVSNTFMILALVSTLFSILPLYPYIDKTTYYEKYADSITENDSETERLITTLHRLITREYKLKITRVPHDSRAVYIQSMEKSNSIKAWGLAVGILLLSVGFFVTVLLMFYVLSTASFFTAIMYKSLIS